VLDRGTVVRSGTIETIRATVGNRFQIGWQGDGARFIEGLARLGARITAGGVEGKAMVTVPAGWNTTSFFQCAQSNGVVLMHLKPDEEDLERLFFRVTSQSQPAELTAPTQQLEPPAPSDPAPVSVGPEGAP
jgi:hypothetical protein